MRPLPADPVPGAPAYVRGIALVRGEAAPVVDLSLLVSGEPVSEPRRMLSLRVGSRRVAALVDDVVGVRRALPEGGIFPPLLAGARPEVLEELRALDGELLRVLALGEELVREVP